MDFQFFEIQIFEKTMKNYERTMKNHEHIMTNHEKTVFDRKLRKIMQKH